MISTTMANDRQPMTSYSRSVVIMAQSRLIFTVRRNARIASAVLATAIPSVCSSVRLSVTRRYCVKTTARSTMQFALSAKCI